MFYKKVDNGFYMTQKSTPINRIYQVILGQVCNFRDNPSLLAYLAKLG